MSAEEETKLEDHPHRRSEDKIPSAYKLWMQTALNNMQTPPQMIADIKKAIEEANETLIHKINNNIQAKVGEVQIEHERFKGDVEAKLSAINASARTLMWVFGIASVLLAGSFTLVSIFK